MKTKVTWTRTGKKLFTHISNRLIAVNYHLICFIFIVVCIILSKSYLYFSCRICHCCYCCGCCGLSCHFVISYILVPQQTIRRQSKFQLVKQSSMTIHPSIYSFKFSFQSLLVRLKVCGEPSADTLYETSKLMTHSVFACYEAWILDWISFTVLVREVQIRLRWRSHTQLYWAFMYIYTETNNIQAGFLSLSLKLCNIYH